MANPTASCVLQSFDDSALTAVFAYTFSSGGNQIISRSVGGVSVSNNSGTVTLSGVEGETLTCTATITVLLAPYYEEVSVSASASHLFPALGKVAVRLAGVWANKSLFVRVGGAWVLGKVFVRSAGVWVKSTLS